MDYWDSGRGTALRVFARILFMIPAAIVYFFVYLARRIKRWHYSGAARSWPAADGKVTSSFQIDENEVSFSTNGWDLFSSDRTWDHDDRQEERDYNARWAVALQYSYQADGESYAGTYFLPATYKDGDLADDAATAWINRTITVRYNHSRPRQSFFLEQDGAPGKPHIPRLLKWKPYVTELSLK
ncbi:MAG TPA: DUF3592 domain-containing protein [Candidatus Angelobacter sp.]|jgi:hypothetical protein